MPVFAQPASSAESADMPAVQQLWQQWSERLSSVQSDRLITQQTLNQFPQRLLLPESQYPNLSLYSWPQLEALYAMHRDCDGASLQQISDQSPSWRRAVAFERHLCLNGDFSSDWQSSWSELHPAGGSYADRYLGYLKSQPDKAMFTAFLDQHADSLTLANPNHPLHAAFATLSSSGQAAILGGYRYFLSEDGSLWRSDQKGIDVLQPEQWQAVADDIGLMVSRLGNAPDQACAFQYSNLCISPMPEQAIWWQSALVFLLVVVLGMALNMLLERRRAMKERQFILQLLTHELRTPVASLGLTVEQFRDQFDSLSDPAQDAFYRLSGDFQRLARLTETSQGFLSDQQEAMNARYLVLFSDWLESVAAPYNLNYALEGDREIALPYYWLGVCLDNLIRNAMIHGQPPVRLQAKIDVNQVWIEVSDQGQAPVPGWWPFSRAQSSQGMGIGLMIVRRLMRRLGGRLTHRRNPTRYKLELPL
ncbi:DUF3404 domain-containing protein [Photobacterium galatheae]|uniref:ATP-binding protein n=1 Tax=Photobacterium galatheae TaxID=1654360 RepID=UPI00202CF9CB|nr:DUF3404 domain-containing protein [Photobacterium galatheae]MCM0148767.1 DUF3404 domain-containing protein [Photobacterium galatheae]